MKKLLSLILALTLAVGLMACSPSSPSSSSEGGEESPSSSSEGGDTQEKYVIAMMVKDSTTPFWRYLIDGAMAVGEELGVEVIEYAPLQTQNLEEQVRQVEDAIQQGVDAICIAPIDSEGIIPAIEKANEAGIPVITTNSKANGGEIETFVGVDNYSAAKTMAEFVMEEIGGEGNVIIIEGNPAGQTSQDRVRGMTEIIEQYPDVNLLVSQPGMFNRNDAMTIMENLIQSNSDIDAVLALNDEMALGARQALVDAGLEDVMITGFDGAKEGLEAIISGEMYASLNQAPHDQGGEAVRAAVAILNGESVDDWIVVGGDVCHPDNAEELLERFN